MIDTTIDLNTIITVIVLIISWYYFRKQIKSSKEQINFFKERDKKQQEEQLEQERIREIDYLIDLLTRIKNFLDNSYFCYKKENEDIANMLRESEHIVITYYKEQLLSDFNDFKEHAKQTMEKLKDLKTYSSSQNDIDNLKLAHKKIIEKLSKEKEKWL
ncbi:MAG: hypothetical protein LBG21_06650 [Campylobacteraceae bacterium]|nr:hypothetical protein [Campylobacteraceae bacterium]